MVTKKEEDRILAQAQTALDQMWSSAELLMEYIHRLSEDGIPPDASPEVLDVAKLCCELVGWELTARVLSREQFLKCEILDDEEGRNDDLHIKVKTIDGDLDYFVPKADVRKTEQPSVRVKAHRVIDDNFAVFADGGRRVVVPSSEIVCEG